MEETIIKKKILGLDRMRELNARRNLPGALRMSVQLGLYFGSAALLVVGGDQGSVVFGVALAVSAVVQFGFFGMLHEACHRTIFRARWLNDMAGWFAALGQPMSPALMRAFHYEHHRHTHELERDPELAGMAFMVGWPRGLMWVATMTGLPVLTARVGWTLFAALVPQGLSVWTKVLPFVKAQARRRVAWEARALVLIHGGLVALALTLAPGIAWVYVGMLLGHALLSPYITCEHRGLPEGTGVPILAKTRSLQTPWLVRWLLWNMPFHAEHHGWPSVPFYNLSTLHEEVRAHLVHRERPLRLHLRGGRGQVQLPS